MLVRGPLILRLCRHPASHRVPLCISSSLLTFSSPILGGPSAALNALRPRSHPLYPGSCRSPRSFSFSNVRPNDHKTTKPISVDPPNPVITDQAEQRRKDWIAVRRLMENVWPKNDWGTRGRVILGFALLISGKVWLLYLFFSMRGPTATWRC